jgi:hypothetical protein
MFSKTSGCHIKYHVLQATYVHNKEATVTMEKARRPMEEIVVLRDRCINAFLLFLVCYTIFSNKSQIMLSLFIFSTSRT